VPACPQCGQENPEGFKFCGACAAPLAEAAPAEAEERKLVSVLFVDLVGHTAASDRADPEDVRARLRPYHQLLKREIERYGGTVEKFIGDAVMAVFGAPVSHEDDAERAVRSALRILEAVEELELEVRAAIATGEAVVSLQARPEQGEGIVAGDVVNTASRLQQAAPVRGLVVGEVTYRATRDAIEYEELEPVTVKGKAEPVPIWRALRARARFGVDAEAAPQTPFVGREHDLALLQDAYARAAREQAVQLVTIGGEPGVGKTRLVAEFRTWLDDQPERIRWRQGRCLPYGEGITFWALGEIVKAQAGILESDSPETAANKLETAVRADVEDESEHDWLASRLAPLVGAPTEAGAAEQSESFTAWRRFLERLAAQRPLVLLFEDLHWADTALFDFLDELVDWASGVPTLVLCTARPELYERNPGWGGGKRNSTTASLSPLTTEETARLLSALLSRAVLPAETQAALLERAGGNPLYAEEFVRMLSDQGVLTDQGELVGNGEIALPETVHALIAARLDTLAPERKALLHDASVVGKVFWPGAVASIGGTDAVAVRERLRELVRKELVRPARASSVEGEDEFSFWHALVRDVAYGQIPRAARAEKHRAAAEWMEATAGERVADQAELLAYHYGEALGLARAAGRLDEAEQLEERTRHFLLLAGERAQPLDLGQAEMFYRRALELLPGGHPDRARALLKAGEIGQVKGDSAEAERLLEEAIGEFRRQSDVLGVGEATLWLSTSMWFRGDVDQANALLEDAIALLEDEPPSRVLAQALGVHALWLAIAGRSREALAAAEQALPLTEELGSALGLHLALMARGTARCDLGDPGGLDDLHEAARRALDTDAGRAVVAYVNLAHSLWLIKGPALALESARAGIELGERRGALAPGLWCQAETVWKLFDLGRWDELLEVADEVVEADRARGGSQVEMIALPYRAKVLLLRGDLRAAAPLVEQFLPRAREIGNLQILVPALISAALAEQARGNPGEALARVQEFAEVTRDRAAWTRGVHLPDAFRLLTSAGELELAETLPPTETEVDTRTKHAVETARAILAEARAEPEQAAELYARAAERWAEYGSVFERAHALFGRGRCLVALGRAEEAEDDLRGAREIFLGLGAAPLVAEIDALLGGNAAATGS